MRSTFLIFGTLFGLSFPVSAHHSETFTYLKKPPALMPTYIARSGYCCVSHDIQPDGRVSNVAATYCTDAHLKPYAKKSVERYVFEPERKDGTPVTAKSLTIKLAWHIVDDFGQTVVGGNGFMTPRPDGSHDTEMICSAEIA